MKFFDFEKEKTIELDIIAWIEETSKRLKETRSAKDGKSRTLACEKE